MANGFEFKVTGVQELANNLANFGSPKMLGKIVGKALGAGAAIAVGRARINARALGLGFVGFKPRRQEGESHGQSRRYGRIPRSIKPNKAYMPRGVADTYRLNIVARGQRFPGIYKNKAPHAQLIEYGFRHLGSGKRIAGRPFMGPALDSTAAQVTEAIAQRMSGLIDGLKFPTTGKGP
jgi:hypothetical protein